MASKFWMKINKDVSRSGQRRAVPPFSPENTAILIKLLKMKSWPVDP